MIQLYDKHTIQERFDMNGIRILKPITCYTTEELNGDYSLEMTYKISDEDDAWEFLEPYAIIKNSEGQLFSIYDVEMSDEDDIITVKARHIFYYLADKMVINCKYDNYNCDYALIALKACTEISWGSAPGTNYTEYDFTYSTNLNDKLYNINYNYVNPVYALLGASDSIVNIYSGEIHRDNFRVSINAKKEGSRDNAFTISRGINMLAIREKINVDNALTTLHYADNFGQGGSAAYPSSSMFPHQIIKYIKFSYSVESRVFSDADAYFRQNESPKFSYSVRFKDLKKFERYSEWAKLQSYKIGDVGLVHSEKYKISTNQKIISRKLNDITEEVEEITLGNFMPNLFYQSRFSVATHDSASKRLDALESRI